MANYGSLCRSIENDKETNSQISQLEVTVGVNWCVSVVFKYSLDLFCDYQSVSIAGVICSKTLHVVSNIN